MRSSLSSVRTFPARGTWIEMCTAHRPRGVRGDVPRKGNVDRNRKQIQQITENIKDVPRKGNVDRNIAAAHGGNWIM